VVVSTREGGVLLNALSDTWQTVKQSIKQTTLPVLEYYVGQLLGTKIFFNLGFFFLWRCDPTRAMASSFFEVYISDTTTQHSR